MRADLRGAIALGAVLAVVAALAPAAPPVAAQGASGPLCVLSAAEMGKLVDAPIVATDAVDLECAYDADPAVRQLQVVLFIIPPDPTAFDTGGGPLQGVRIGHDSHGRDLKISGQPAWVADDGVWVAVGDDVLGVLVDGVFDASPPPMPDTAVAIAKAVVPRYLKNPRPSPSPAPPPTGVSARFPTTLADQPLEIQRMSGPDLFEQLGYNGPPASDHVPELQAAVTGLGITPDALEVGYGSVFDYNAGAFLEAYAIRAPGLDATPLLAPAEGAFITYQPAAPEATSLAGHDATLIAPAVPDDVSSPHWFFVDGDVLWVLSGDADLADAFASALPPAVAG